MDYTAVAAYAAEVRSDLNRTAEDWVKTFQGWENDLREQEPGAYIASASFQMTMTEDGVEIIQKVVNLYDDGGVFVWSGLDKSLNT